MTWPRGPTWSQRREYPAGMWNELFMMACEHAESSETAVRARGPGVHIARVFW